MRLIPIAISICALSHALFADELKLKDGRTLVGKVTAQGDRLSIATRDGTVVIDADEVASRRTDAELRAELRRLAKISGDSARHEVELAKTAFAFGLTNQMWKHLDRFFEKVEPTERTATRRCQELLARLGPELLSDSMREKSTRDRVRGMLRMAHRQTSQAKRSALVELLVHEPDADETLRTAAQNEGNPEQRLFALEALARRPDERNQMSLCRAIVVDKEREIREATAALVRDHGDPVDVIERIAPGFLHDNPAIRGRTAQALEYLAHPEGAKYLVAAGPVANLRRVGGGQIGVRAHMFQRTQRSYIRDFEVEIAQAAAVANPVIGTVDDGVVLDVRVGGVFGDHSAVLKAYRKALQRIVGEDPGPDPRHWRAWWESHRPQPTTGQTQR